MFFKKLKVGKIYTLVSKTTKVKYQTMLTSIVEIPEKDVLYNFSGISSLTEEKLYKYYIIKRG